MVWASRAREVTVELSPNFACLPTLSLNAMDKSKMQSLRSVTTHLAKQNKINNYVNK